LSPARPTDWGLRKYKGVEPVKWADGSVHCLGLEPTPELFVAHLVEVFREVRRVLRDDGVVFCNLGDSYASQGGLGKQGSTSQRIGRSNAEVQEREASQLPPPGLKPKDLCGIPWRVAFALQADGWYLRSDIVWAKANPMPESVTDRPTRAHEYVFLLTKRPRYYYDADAVRERQGERTRRQKTFRGGCYTNNATFDNSYDYSGHAPYSDDPAGGSGRNLRTVWNIPTQSFADAHFATFPYKLVEPCILAGTSEKGACPECGKPWERVVEKARSFESGSGKAGNMPLGKNGPNMQGGGETLDVRRGPTIQTNTLGWRPACKCDPLWDQMVRALSLALPRVSSPRKRRQQDAADRWRARAHGYADRWIAPRHHSQFETDACLVLDPFAGSGTVGVVCGWHGRTFYGIDASAEYCEMARKRIANPEPRPVEPDAEGQLTLFKEPTCSD
jgi:DNA modification methylase